MMAEVKENRNPHDTVIAALRDMEAKRLPPIKAIDACRLPLSMAALSSDFTLSITVTEDAEVDAT